MNEGLSSEYIKNRKTEDGDVDEPTAKFDADRQVNSKYFVNQILQQGEEGLRDAWSKVSICAQLRCSSTRQAWPVTSHYADQSKQTHPTTGAPVLTVHLHDMQATSAKHYEEKDARLEYLSWRVWFMKRNHARVKREDAKVLAAEKIELPEDEHVLDTEDASDEDTPLIFDPTLSQRDPSSKPPRPTSEKIPQPSKGVKPVATKSDRKTADFTQDEDPGLENISAIFDRRVDGLYIILISLHGLVRGQQMELGKDPDTGGQVGAGCFLLLTALHVESHPSLYASAW